MEACLGARTFMRTIVQMIQQKKNMYGMMYAAKSHVYLYTIKKINIMWKM